MYTIDEVISRLQELREIHGGDVPFVIATIAGSSVYENAAVELGFARVHDDGEGGELFQSEGVTDENGQPVCIVF